MHICLMCEFWKNTVCDFSCKDMTIKNFLAATCGTIITNEHKKHKFILCDGHIAIFSQYFPCKIIHKKHKVNSNGINAILHVLSGGKICTYVDKHGIMHFYDCKQPFLHYISKIALLEWEAKYSKMVITLSHMFNYEKMQKIIYDINRTFQPKFKF